MINNKYFKIMPDKMYLKLKYYYYFRKRLNLKNPRTLNEKINWLKLNNRKPIYTKMVDKFEVKKIVSKIIGKNYVIPTIGVYDSFEEIDFNDLPDKFVMKCTHDSGGLVICKDKNRINITDAKRKIESCLKNEYYYHAREWPYKNVVPRIIIEEYMEDKKYKELRDYKFLCFNGVPKIMYVATNRQGDGDTYFDFYDSSYNHLPFTQGHPNAPVSPEKPKTFEKMKRLAEKLSKGIPFVRIDFYDVDGKLYFGEMTFSHLSGMMPFSPESWDLILGDLLVLPSTEGKRK